MKLYIPAWHFPQPLVKGLEVVLAIFILYARIELQNWHVAGDVWHLRHELYKLFAPLLSLELELKHGVNIFCRAYLVMHFNMSSPNAISLKH